jgi:hypothetical protein
MTEGDRAIRDATRLVLGRRYVVRTGEPRGEFRVGAFMGWRFDIGPEGGDQEPELLTSLPEGWEERYPTCVFELGEVSDHYMLEATEEWEHMTLRGRS